MSRSNSYVTSADNSPPVTAARPKAEPRLRSRFAAPMFLNGVPGIIVAPAGRARYENFDGKIFRSPDDRSVAWDGIDPNLCLEKTGHRSDEIRSYRQNGFLDPAICPVLFLCPVRRGIPLADCDDAPVFPFRDNLVDRSVVLPGGAVAVLVEPDFLSAELSSRQRAATGWHSIFLEPPPRAQRAASVPCRRLRELAWTLCRVGPGLGEQMF